MNMHILGTGSALPSTVVTNDDLTKYMETSDEWIRERTGIGSRHLSTGETVASLAIEACNKALENAGKKAEDVELILVATCSPEMMLPCCACQVQAGIGASKAVAFDVNAACAGFLFSLNTAYSYLKSGMYKNALVVGAEVLSKIMDWEDRTTCILFGDGAGAVYVEAAEDEEDTYSFVQHSDGVKGMVLKCGTRDLNNPLYKGEEQSKFVWMDGREIFKFAVGQIPICINEAMDKAGLTKDNIDLFILHQANKRIISSIAKRMELPEDRFPTNVERVGNMSSAAIPVLLDECNRNGQLKKGMRLVLSGFGAGLTFGASIISW
ncbi:MAG: ketoacyl-ACP synthase III [Lachnospiraceae bacterium]|nr:ketoacyl-ACP synthase III [Lachnospiraceae bacterium]